MHVKGIFVNEDGGIRYAAAIVSGVKPVETRSRNMLSALVGERVAIIRTRRGKSPLVIGYVWITAAYHMSGSWLDQHRDLTLIPKGSRHDCGGKSKWCYFLRDAERCEPYPLPADAVRHGRSWAEFSAPSADPDREDAARVLAEDLDRLAYLVDPYEYWNAIGIDAESQNRNVSNIMWDLLRGRSAAYTEWLRDLLDGDALDDRDRERAQDRLDQLSAFCG